MITVGINALFLIPNQVGGTEYHLRSFVTALQQLDLTHHYVLFCNRENADTFTQLPDNWRKVECGVSARSKVSRIVYEQTVLPILLIRNKCQVLHSFGYFGPIFLFKCRQVITVHDANWLDQPQDNTWLQHIILKILVELNIKYCDLIITDSEFSRRRLLHYFPTIQKKLKVISPAIHGAFKKTKRAQQKSPKLFLCVSNFYPHKKVTYLLDLWKAFTTKHPDKYQLLLIGRTGKERTVVQRLVQNLDSVRMIEKATFPELLRNYSLATVNLAPSVYEGFGYTVYESSSMNIPTIVGKKELYQKNLQPDLLEFSFNVQQDVRILEKSLTHHPKTDVLVLSDMSKPTRAHVRIYETLITI